jgi:predicted transcriptional regulator
VSKLKELGKHVIGLGMQDSTSDLLRDNCDEFIYYEDLGQSQELSPSLDSRLPETKRKAFGLLMESLLALRRENKEVLWSSMVKDTMKRKKPSFNESYHGYRTFSELLEDAQKEGLLELETDKRSRTYVVTRFGAEMTAQPEAAPAAARKKSRRRRSGGKKRAGASSTPTAAESPAQEGAGDASPPAEPNPDPASASSESISDESLTW